MLKTLTQMLLLPATFFVYAEAQGQDAAFTQFYNNPVYTNPAAAGSGNSARVTMAHRIEWPSLPGTFSTSAFTYDQYYSSIRGGFAIQATDDRTYAFRTNSVNVAYAYELRLTRNWRMRAGAEAGYYRKNINFDVI